MRKVRTADVEQVASAASDRRPIADAIGAENMGLNYYELQPGDSFAFGYHSHGTQEELFYVVSGTATFETEDGDVEVGEGEAIRFEPGELQQGFNRSDASVVALAMGAPRDSSGGGFFRDCPDCGDRTPHGLEKRNDAKLAIATCDGCGAETGRWEV